MKTLMIEIKGMECEGCAINVKNSLKKIKGIINIEVNLNEGLAYIEINDKINLNKIEREIREKINNTGYVTGQIRELEE